MTAAAIDSGPNKVADAVWQAARNRPTTCIILVNIPKIGFSVPKRSSADQLVSPADIQFTGYDDDFADRVIDEVADAVEKVTNAEPVKLYSSASIIADLDRAQILSIASLPAVRRIGPNSAFKT